MTIARPASTPAWATDTDYAAGSDPWSGTPTRVEPDSGDKATGAVPGQRSPAQWFNFLVGFLADWILYFSTLIGSNEELTYQTPKTRTLTIPAAGASGGVPVANRVEVRTDFGIIALALSPHLPAGAIITGVKVLLKAGSGSRSGTDRASAQLCEDVVDWGAPTTTETLLGSPVYQAASTLYAVLDLASALPYALGHQDTTSVTLIVQGGVDASTHPDSIDAVQIVYSDHGPRNAGA